MEAVLVAVIAALLIERAVTGRAVARERRLFVNALVARTPAELRVLERSPDKGANVTRLRDLEADEDEYDDRPVEGLG